MVDLRAVRLVGASRFEVVFDTDRGEVTVPCRLIVRHGGEWAEPEPPAAWPDGIDPLLAERAVVEFARAAALPPAAPAAPSDASDGERITDPRHPARRAVEAARRNELDRLRSLVDWPLSGFPSLAEGLNGLDGVDDTTLAWAVGSALAELAAAARDPEAMAGPLRQLRTRLAGSVEVRRASPETTHRALLKMRAPEVPVTLPDDDRRRLREMAERAAAVHEVVVSVDGRGEMPLAVAPDTGLLVVLAER